MHSIKPINLNIFAKLKKDKKYRESFFRAKTRDDILVEIQRMLKTRKISVTKLAQDSGMKQSAVSRLLSSEYSSWTFNTLTRIASGLDAVWELRLVPADEAMQEYDERKENRQFEASQERRIGDDYALVTTADDYLYQTPNVTTTHNRTPLN